MFRWSLLTFICFFLMFQNSFNFSPRFCVSLCFKTPIWNSQVFLWYFSANFISDYFLFIWNSNLKYFWSHVPGDLKNSLIFSFTSQGTKNLKVCSINSRLHWHYLWCRYSQGPSKCFYICIPLPACLLTEVSYRFTLCDATNYVN